jgi:hypothetical protein
MRAHPTQPVPVSRELVRIIRQSSKLEGPNLTLNDHLSAITERQAREIEFYLRTCALRLEQGL